MFDKTATFKLSDDNSPEIIAMEVRHISGKRWLTKEDKSTLAKAAYIIEELMGYKKSWEECGSAIAYTFGFNSDILIDGKNVCVKKYKGE